MRAVLFPCFCNFLIIPHLAYLQCYNMSLSMSSAGKTGSEINDLLHLTQPHRPVGHAGFLQFVNVPPQGGAKLGE